jgi:competence protein ComEC
MCTALQFALASGSTYTALNALGGAAFGMLLWNPAWAGDVGFRLSVLSVGAILAWGVPLCRRLRTGRKPLDAAIGAYVIGTVASLATAPLVSHTFGIVPLAGILLNPVAIVLAAAVVGAGTLWLIAPLPFLAPPLRFVAGYAAEGIDALARLAAELPGGTLEYTLPAAPAAAAYALFAVATLFAWSLDGKRPPTLRA